MADPLAGTGAKPAATPPPSAVPAAPSPAAAGPGVSTPAAPVKADGSIIAPAAAAPALSEVDARAALTKAGMKAEDLAKLSAEDAVKQATEAQDKATQAADTAAIEFKVPEGIEMSQELQDQFKGIVGDPKLSPSDRAQKLLDLHASALTAAAKAPHDLWAKTQGEWQASVKADPELGGKNYDAVRSTIAKAVTSVLGKDAGPMFDAFLFTGAGNNPAIVRGMYRMSKAITEGGPVSGDALSTGKGADFATRVASMYPSAQKAA